MTETRSPVICLMGPTASGKTDLACELVQRLPCEIISVDSAMIYRGMNIGTAKPDASTLAHAPHHLIDILDPVDTYSAAQFCIDANVLCQSIIGRGKIPLLVGGTMMYFRALQQGLSVLPASDATIRAELMQQADSHGWDFMHKQLARIDPDSAIRIHPHDTQRIQRALEVYALTGQTLTAFLSQGTKTAAHSFINFIIFPSDRAWLHRRIGVRFKQMLAAGFIDEVRDLLNAWPLTLAHPAMRCVGYRQVYDYLQGDDVYQTLVDQGEAATRQLAKRQLTWLRHWSFGYRLEAEAPDRMKQIMAILENGRIAS